MNDEEKKVLNETADAITDKRIIITVAILHPTLRQKWRKEKSKTFVIQPATLGTLVKISKELLAIDLNADNNNWLELSHKLMLTHGERMAKIIAYAIVNSKADPPGGLVEFLLYNLSSDELAMLTKHVLNQMNIAGFISSIVSIKGTNIFETSLNQGS